MSLNKDSFGRNYVQTPLGDNIDKSSLKLLKAVFDVVDDQNVVSSPLGLMMLLALYNSGASSGTRVEITKFLGGLDHESVSNSFRDLSEQVAPEALKVANKVYVSKKYSLQDTFTATALSYRSEVDTLDFSQPKAAAAEINDWANEKTKGNIKEPVNPDMLDATVAAALFNVIFFKGHWFVPFKSEETKDKDFYISESTVVKKPMMHLLKPLFYAESPELGARLVELLYRETGFRMVVVLPNKVDRLPLVLEKAAEMGVLNDVFNLKPLRSAVDLDMPKFDIKSKLDFNIILPKIGVSKLFSESAGGIVKGKSVTVSKAFQEAFIKVDEEGATAGAFTGMVIVLKSSRSSRPPPPIKFTVDHPFLYLILHEDKILFTGTYTQ